MAGYKNKASGMVNDYANIRSLPAILSAVFAGASLYQFGGISDITLTWLGGSGGYTLTAEHAVLVSAAVYLVAFMGSQTKDFEYYEDWEKVAIALGPAVILGEQYTSEVTNFLTDIGDPLGFQLAFVVAMVSYGVAVR